MANVLAVRPTRLETEKTAQQGTLMMRRSDVLGMVRKCLHYADAAIALANEEGRVGDLNVQHARRRALVALRDGLQCVPLFENPAAVTAIPYSDAASAIEARSGETTQIGSTEGESAVGNAETPKGYLP